MGENKGMKIKFPTIALLILSLTGLSLTPATAATDTSAKGITVSATGTVKVTPDTVRLSATISALAATNKEALAKANESANTFRTVLLAAKIDKKDIKTQSFSVSPEYNYTQDKGQVLLGYRVSQSTEVIIRDEKNAGPIIDAIVASSGEELLINSVSPFVLETKKATTTARTVAVRSAKTKASAYAKLLGVRLGKVAYLNENSSPVYTGPVYAMAKDSVSATQIDLGQQEITVTVEVRWNIG
jgi:uncharacterized protein YggE